MKVVINGEVQDLLTFESLADLVMMLGFDSGPRGGIAVAVDGEVVSRREWKTTRVEEGQRIEIVRAVQGG